MGVTPVNKGRIRRGLNAVFENLEPFPDCCKVSIRDSHYDALGSQSACPGLRHADTLITLLHLKHGKIDHASSYRPFSTVVFPAM